MIITEWYMFVIKMDHGKKDVKRSLWTAILLHIIFEWCPALTLLGYLIFLCHKIFFVWQMRFCWPVRSTISRVQKRCEWSQKSAISLSLLVQPRCSSLAFIRSKWLRTITLIAWSKESSYVCWHWQYSCIHSTYPTSCTKPNHD